MTDFSMPGMSGYDLLKRLKVNFIFINFYFFEVLLTFEGHSKSYMHGKMLFVLILFSLFFHLQKSRWKDVPVVVMSSENVPSRINM